MPNSQVILVNRVKHDGRDSIIHPYRVSSPFNGTIPPLLVQGIYFLSYEKIPSSPPLANTHLRSSIVERRL